MATVDIEFANFDETPYALGPYPNRRVFGIAIEGSAPPTLVYRMRGYDTTLVATVFWGSVHVDAAAADYDGPGPVINIVVHKKLGT